MFVARKAIQSEARVTRDEVSGVEECGRICLEDSTDFLFVETYHEATIMRNFKSFCMIGK